MSLTVRLPEELACDALPALVMVGSGTATTRARNDLLATRRHTIWWLALVGYLVALALALALAALWPRRWAGLDPVALDELSEAAPVFVVGLVAGSKVTVYQRNFNKARDDLRCRLPGRLVPEPDPSCLQCGPGRIGILDK
jgi:hypothetical protein